MYKRQGYYFVPDYPAGLEPDAYVFAGWYTTAGLYEGSEANMNEMTMPAGNVILYAKWTPKNHTVKTYLTEAVMDGNPMDTWSVPHSESVNNPPQKPTNGNYEFVGWFYKTTDADGNEVEKAFDFSMPVNRDLNLYAKWRSNTPVNYNVRYVLQDVYKRQLLRSFLRPRDRRPHHPRRCGRGFPCLRL